MANAKKVRDVKFPQTDFEIPVTDAVGQLINANQVLATDSWRFQVSGDTLIITRIRATEVAGPPDP
jgi:hypothetical protein